MKYNFNDTLSKLKKLMINEEKYHEITLRIEITRFIYWQLHVLLALGFIFYYKIGQWLSTLLKRKTLEENHRHQIFSKKLANQMLNGCWKYSLAQIMFKVEESFYYSNLNLESPSLEIGSGDCTTSNIFFDGKKIDIASDITYTFYQFTPEAQKIFNHFLTCDAQHLPFKNGQFQDIVMVHVADHIPQFINCSLDEVSRILKNGGNFYFSGLSDYWRRLQGWTEKDDMPCFSGKHYNLYNHDEWEKILESKGMKLVDHGYFISGYMAQLFRLTLFLYHAKRDGLKIFEKIPVLDRWYSEMIVNFFVPLCEKNILECKEQDHGIHFWVQARKVDENGN